MDEFEANCKKVQTISSKTRVKGLLAVTTLYKHTLNYEDGEDTIIVQVTSRDPMYEVGDVVTLTKTGKQERL